MTTHIISHEEKAFLDCAKKVAKLWGQSNGRLITAKDSRPAEAALVELVQLGRVNVGGQFLFDKAE